MKRGHGMTGAGRAIQILMFCSNFFIWIGSVVVLAFGILALAAEPYLEKILGEHIYKSAAAILIAVGILSFLISFIGCFGAVKEIKCMLLTYFIMMLILFGVLLVGGVLGFVFISKAEINIRNGMYRSLREYREGSRDPITEAWDEAQREMECCGITSQSDWLSNVNFNYNGKRMPTSCCRRAMSNPEVYLPCERNNANAYLTPCYAKARELAKKHATWIGAAGIAVSVIMILGLMFSMILFKMIK